MLLTSHHLRPSQSQPMLDPETERARRDEEKEAAPSPQRTTAKLRLYSNIVICVNCILLLALALGVSLGQPSKGQGDLSLRPGTFNYSAYYGIPESLPTIPTDQLANATELDLRMGFVVKREPAVREYVFNITQGLAAPDGFHKPMILVNGRSPGPLLEANTGDTLRVRVNNMIGNWSTTIHWHGIDQRNTTWMDGVAGVSQCGIPPGQSLTYEFSVAGQRGTFWYHSHLSVQYSDGLYGPIVSSAPKRLVNEIRQLMERLPGYS